MRFGIATGQENTTWDTLRALWKAADAIDVWESAWVGDHFYPFLTEPDGPCFEGWVTLASLVQHTGRIQAGMLVSGMPHRHPSVLAKMAATLDVISGGRLNLGLGAAWNERECGALGIDLGDLPTRMDRFAEGVEVIGNLLRTPSTTFGGRHFRLADARCEPRRHGRPHLPITIGGTGLRRTLPVVARWADQWDLGFTPPPDVPRLLGLLTERCAEIGRAAGEITPSIVVRTVRWEGGRKDPREVAEELAAYEEAGCRLAIVEAVAEDAADAEREVERLTDICGASLTTGRARSRAF